MAKIRALVRLLPALLIAPHALAARTLDVNFTISGTEGFNGVDAASLNLVKGHLTGTVTIISPDGSFPCTVNNGSADIHSRLNLTCTVGPAEMITLSGKLNPGSGLGKGKFSETFFKETGTFAATPAR